MKSRMSPAEFYATFPHVPLDNVYMASLLGVAEEVPIEGEDDTDRGSTYAHKVAMYFDQNVEGAIQQACGEAMETWKKEEGWTRRMASVHPVRTSFINMLVQRWQEGTLNKPPDFSEEGRMIDCDAYAAGTGTGGVIMDANDTPF